MAALGPGSPLSGNVGSQKDALHELHFVPLPVPTNVYAMQVLDLAGEAIVLVGASSLDGQHHVVTAAKFNRDANEFEASEPNFVYLPTRSRIAGITGATVAAGVGSPARVIVGITHSKVCWRVLEHDQGTEWACCGSAQYYRQRQGQSHCRLQERILSLFVRSSFASHPHGTFPCKPFFLRQLHDDEYGEGALNVYGAGTKVVPGHNAFATLDAIAGDCIPIALPFVPFLLWSVGYVLVSTP